MIKYLLIFLPILLAAVIPGPGLHEGKSGDCLVCHEGMLKKEFSHPGVETGCLICHVAIDTIHPGEGTKDFSLPSPVPALCLECHTEMDESIQPPGFAHGPVKNRESCLACHDPHASDVAKQLLRPSRELCISCHNAEIRGDSGVIKAVGRTVMTARYVHPAAEADGGCIICHFPHFSEKRKLLTASFPDTRYAAGLTENYEVCFMCHDGDLLVLENTMTATGFRDGDRNLHYLHSGGDRGRNCTICHDAHASAWPAITEESVRFGEWQVRMNFARTDTGGSCATACHGPKLYDRENAVKK